jgi:hypothetical protein
VLRPVFGDDLRVTVHVQDAAAFLGDVRDHRFDLITDLSPGQAAELSRLALDRLATGAIYMTRHSPAQLTEMLSMQGTAAGNQESALDPNRFVLAHLPGELNVTLIARGPQRIQAKRRGGRRASPHRGSGRLECSKSSHRPANNASIRFWAARRGYGRQTRRPGRMAQRHGQMPCRSLRSAVH